MLNIFFEIVKKSLSKAAPQKNAIKYVPICFGYPIIKRTFVQNIYILTHQNMEQIFSKAWEHFSKHWKFLSLASGIGIFLPIWRVFSSSFQSVGCVSVNSNRFPACSRKPNAIRQSSAFGV